MIFFVIVDFSCSSWFRAVTSACVYASAYRILDHIARDIEQIVLIAKNTLKVTLLPKPVRDAMTS